MKNFDDVNGIIIGGDAQLVGLVAPNGKEQIKKYIDSNIDPKQWGVTIKNELLSEPCGTGNPLSFYPDIVESIYGSGEWSVRVYQ
jgi:hypothetical protein